MPSKASMLPLNSLAYALQQAALVVVGVFGGQSLADGAVGRVDAAARPAVQDLVYGTLRAYGRGDFFLAQLLAKPLYVPEIRALLLVSLYRLETRSDSEHTVVDQAVEAAGTLAGGNFRGLVNGVLRNFLRQRPALEAKLAADAVASRQHPDWWLAELRRAWPDDSAAVAEAGNQPPPMGLRVNERRVSANDYLARLNAVGIAARALGDAAIALERPVAVERLPGFADGDVSVQDPGAQQAALWLAPAPGSRVLDACAAPGGKTAHLLERGDIDLLALDLKAARCRRVEANLARLGLNAAVRVADCAKPETWWDGVPFDAVLADVPCSASGVVRRNPDAKWLRQAADIASFARAQARILRALWPLLKPGGRLLYATCSVFPAENDEQIAAFLADRSDARCLRQEQLLPTAERDGFYYALLEKHA